MSRQTKRLPSISMNFGAAIVASSPSGVSAALSCTTARRRDRGNKGKGGGRGGGSPTPSGRPATAVLQLPNLFGGERSGNHGRRAPAIPSAREGGAPSGSGSLPGHLYRHSRHPCETKMSSSSLPQAGPVCSSERQEPHRPLAHGPKPYERRGNAIRADEVERIRIWRGFLIDAKNTLHIRSAKTAKTRPLARSRRRWIRGPRSGLRPPCLTHPATLSHPDWRGRSRLPYG